MLRRFSDLLCGKCCFYSLILAFIISLGYINIANAYVCFLPDHSDCADGDYKDFWPCSGSDCIDAKDGECDASYNSSKSNNDCGDVCTKCADSSSPYNGLYKCPENTCNCNEYTSTSAYNECGESCKVCRIAGDKNYGKYKCPAVPEEGCANPCKDCTLTEAQAQAKMAADPCMECEQCANLNCTDAQQSKWRCSENKLCKQCRAEGYNKDKNSSEYIVSQQTCSRMQCEECPYNDISDGVEWYKCGECGSEYTQNYNNLTNPQDKVNHCDENRTCGCYMVCDNCFGKEFTMQDCKNAGYDSAKNECSGIRGTVYEKCCRTCDGYMYPTDLSKTSEGWSCTECPDFCGGGSKYSCGCKEGYHDDNGSCVLNQCTSGVEESTCNTSTHNFFQTGSYVNVSGQTIKCGSCVSDCNINDNQYPDHRSCDEEWHGYWACMKNETTGCYYPICDSSMDYYDDESDCWHYGTQEEGTCRLAEATKNSEIQCYEIWSYECGPNAYARKSDCEYSEIAQNGYGYCKQDDTGCWVGYHDEYYDPSRGYIHIACDDEFKDYGQDDNYGCPGYAEMFDENNRMVAQVRFSRANHFYQLPTGRYTVKFHPGVCFNADADFAYTHDLKDNPKYGLVDSFTFKVNSYEEQWGCGFGPGDFYEEDSLRSVTCEERCFCNDNWNVVDCFNDYSITFDYMSEQDTIVVDFMPKNTPLYKAVREPPYYRETSRNNIALNDGSHQCTYTITTKQWAHGGCVGQ